MASKAAGPGIDKEAFPDYEAAHTVIKCPYLPPDLSEVPTCHDKKATCVGTSGHDLILGSDEKDVIVAAPGNDTVHGDAEDDILCGGPGNDSLFGARGADIIYGGPDDDWLFGAPDPDELYGGPGDFDVLWEGPGFGKVDGGPGAYDVCMLQREMGLAERPETPLIGVVGRLADQKGLDLLVDLLPEWARSRDAQWGLLGTGEPHYEQMLRDLAAKYPAQVAAQIEFSDALAHQIRALGIDADDGLIAVFHADRDLFQVQQDFENILLHTLDRAVLMQHTLDLGLDDGTTRHRRKQDASQRVAQSVAETAL